MQALNTRKKKIFKMITPIKNIIKLNVSINKFHWC
jgi:hypothetical protein